MDAGGPEMDGYQPGTRVTYPVAPGSPTHVTGTVVGVTDDGDPLVRSDAYGGVVMVDAEVCEVVPVVVGK